jgi:hypothetical protein
MAKDKLMTEWADLTKTAMTVEFKNNDLLPYFQRVMWAERVVKARQVAVSVQARGFGSRSGYRAQKSKCLCADGSEFNRPSKLIKVAVRTGDTFRLLPVTYFVQREGTQWWKYLRVFECWSGDSLESSSAGSLDKIEQSVSGMFDLIVLQGQPFDLKTIRLSTLRRLFDAKQNDVEEGVVFEFHFDPFFVRAPESVQVKSRWTPIQKNGKVLLQEFKWFQFNKIETLEEALS